MAANFYGYDFDGEYLLFGDEFTEEPGVYVIYTQKACLDIGDASNLKDAIETHQNTRNWVKLAGDDEIYVAFYLETNQENRQEMKRYLQDKMSPLCC